MSKPVFKFTSTKELGESSKKTYKSKLNKLVAHGILSSEDLVNHPTKTIQAINSLTESISPDEKQRTERRTYYSAIFYALHDHPWYLKMDNLYRKAFHENDPLVNKKDGTPWDDRWKTSSQSNTPSA